MKPALPFCPSGLGVALGAGVGTALGVSSGWAVGLAVGAAILVAMSFRRSRSPRKLVA
ncbi:MAG TPA: hypothetical protein VHE13_13815 [Opitutus sp.]|nr:hypothetical protein [Opitutus sp.]